MPDPILVKKMELSSADDAAIDYEIFALPLTSNLIVEALRSGKADAIAARVDRTVRDLGAKGADVVGLGGLLSVITGNGLAVSVDGDGPIVTTGNTYTVALAAEAVVQAVQAAGIDPVTARIGIIGAGGNIGSTLVQILSRHFRSLRLVGRKESFHRVERALEANYAAILERLRGGCAGDEAGLAAALADAKTIPWRAMHDAGGAAGNSHGPEVGGGARLRMQLKSVYGDDPFVSLSTDIEDLQDCDVIVSASNAIQPILNAGNVGGKTRIICDVAVPSDVAADLIEARPDITLIRGGVARAPNGNAFTLDMIDLPKNHMLACMTETALLGFAGRQGYATTGEIDANGVDTCHKLGARLGFSLGCFANRKPIEIAL